MSAQKASAEYSQAAIAEELRRQGESGLPVGAQIFFSDEVSSDRLHEFAADLVRAAEARFHRPGGVVLGKVRISAKSASVSGDPEAIAWMQENPAVKAVLPNVIEDIHPKPVGRRGL